MSSCSMSRFSQQTGLVGFVSRQLELLILMMSKIPHSFIAFLARFSIAITFWTSGQTKIEGLVLDPINLDVQWGMPHISEGAIELFRSEYALPLLPPEFAATMAAGAEHFFPFLLLLGLASRFSAFALLIMTLVIQTFVYPLAFPTHGLWAALMLYIMARGPGVFSLDHLFFRRTQR
ncbi:MAG: DoxX family protein [Arenimonas sp.]